MGKEGQEDAKMEEETEEQEQEIKVELTEEEKEMWFRKSNIPDLAPRELALWYSKFTIPTQDEGFDAIKFVWQPAKECEKYLKQWLLEKKLTQRVEDLQPSEWFKGKWSEWLKLLSSWKKRQQEFKNPSKKVATSLPKQEGKERGEEDMGEDDKPETEIDVEGLD